MALRHCSEPSVGRRIWVNMAVSMGNPSPRYCAGQCASIVENASAAQHFGRYDDRSIAVHGRSDIDVAACGLPPLPGLPVA
ncbi:hypothetical protein D7S70_02855 [Ralstonia pickettii]|nr:hypothetical protein [Ralstonia pickettii]MBB0126773.1 hypothetical protein [Ralstonia pickettii]MBB0161733.1 hypothetical protein [Ralstonia pickettii]MBB0204462.1 hypothetical protein [Ralstonia pickettii]MBB0209592.1 hypothetical protein [Ralstonia pickettii]